LKEVEKLSDADYFIFMTAAFQQNRTKATQRAVAKKIKKLAHSSATGEQEEETGVDTRCTVSSWPSLLPDLSQAAWNVIVFAINSHIFYTLTLPLHMQ
jgi:hypothetical protein